MEKTLDQYPCLKETAEGIVLFVDVQPRARKSEISEIQGKALKVRLAAPPVEGAANEECLRFLAKSLGVPYSRLRMVRGHRSRHKTLLVRGVDIEVISDVLNRWHAKSDALQKTPEHEAEVNPVTATFPGGRRKR
jgi:uncharacterized protein (TIGR00251 family)